MKVNDRELLRSELNKIGKGFCLAKWFELDLDLSLGQNRSCDLVDYHSIPLDDLKSNIDLFHNSDYKKIQRKFMLDEIQPKECKLCWDFEKATKKISPRLEKSSEFYSKENIELIQHAGYENNIDPRHLKVMFSRNDNILSIYQSTYFSQSWQEDIKKNGPYKLSLGNYNNLNFFQFTTLHHSKYRNPYIDLFWIWFSKIYFKLTKLRIYGGDPLMDKNVFRILEFFVNHPNKNLVIEIESSCDPLGDRWKGFVDYMERVSEKIKELVIICKVDSWGKHLEYCNHGLDVKRLEHNLIRFLKSLKNRKLVFQINFHILSYQSLTELMKFILGLRKKFLNKTEKIIFFKIDIISDPIFLHPSMNKELIFYIDDAIAFMKSNLETRGNKNIGFTLQEIESIELVKSKILETNIDITKKIFFEFIHQYDERTNQKFYDTFEADNKKTIEKISRKAL